MDEKTPRSASSAIATATASLWETLRPYAGRVVVTYYVAVLFGVNDGAFGVILPRIKTHYGVNEAVVSVLFLCNTAGYLSAAFVNGLIVHRLGQSGALYLGASSHLLSYILLLVAAPFPAMAVFMLFLGFGMALEDAGVNVVVAEMPYATTLLNLLHAFYGFGALIGPIIASALFADSLSWNVVYMILGGLALINLIALFVIFRRISPADLTHRHASTPPTDPSSTPIKTPTHLLRAAFSLRVTYLGALFLLAYVGVEVTIGGWVYSFLTEIRGGDTVRMGPLVSLYWLGLTFGRVVLGWVTGKFGEKRMIYLYLVVTVGGVLVVWLVETVEVDAAMLFVVGAALGPVFPTTISIASQVVPKELFASSVGFLTAFGSGGAALFPWLTGTIAVRYGIWIMMPFSIALVVVMFAFWIFIPSPKKPAEQLAAKEGALASSETVVRVEGESGEGTIV
ncbi:major facilitator superfamily MFS_1 [Jimgerdemannia flammicorona]|uniref:Major facilitator superfamily MFS_1 n=1 Tax=Jimgerdemannia flammicorona TaxID=994334 RepID=A0A433QVL4_9FUNG|nr:major facilitator superfamily MFS_1 [Jimgerdemannia flammicorona]